LTGKIQDVNVAVLAKELFSLGVTLRRVVVCPDEVDVIADDVQALKRGHDWVVTSGGVGPTHDDVTIRAVARAFGRDVVLDPKLERLLRAYFGERLTDDHLRMAMVPEGADMVSAPGVRWPTVLMENVFILPGLPEVFAMKMPTLRHHIGEERPFLSRAVATRCDEAEIASLLDDLDARFPEVAIGSYPRWGDDPVRVKITFDGRDPGRVDGAVAALVAALPADQIVTEDDPE
ncbi:MAG: molybdopterin-binding protein, partial [Acidobacteriota bacterium]